MVPRGRFDVTGFPMATLLRLPARIHAATQRVHPNLVLCWIAGAVLSLDVLGRGFMGA